MLEGVWEAAVLSVMAQHCGDGGACICGNYSHEDG